MIARIVPQSAAPKSTTRTRALRARQREKQAAFIASLADDKACAVAETGTLDGECKTIQADLGPVRYLATLIGASDEATMRWFMLAVALLLDSGAATARWLEPATRTPKPIAAVLP